MLHDEFFFALLLFPSTTSAFLSRIFFCNYFHSGAAAEGGDGDDVFERREKGSAVANRLAEKLKGRTLRR